MRILITGASSQITQEIASARKSMGDEVILTSHSSPQDEEFECLTFDLAQPERSAEAVEKLALKGLDAVILAAASPTPRLDLFFEQDDAEVKSHLEDNIFGNIFLLKKIMPQFLKQKHGRIIFLSSQTTDFKIKGYAAYAMQKAALDQLISYIAFEYGSERIYANSVSLGVIKTNRNKVYWRRDQIHQKMTEKILLGRLGEPKDILPVIDMLLAENCFIQGQIIQVDGGIKS